MKLLLFAAACTALLLISLLPSKEVTLRNVDSIGSLPSGSRVTISGIAIGNRLCNFPQCIRMHNSGNISGRIKVSGSVQRKWGKETIMVEEIK